MRKLLVAFVVVLSLAGSVEEARAIGVEASVGKGVAIDPTEAQPLNLMVAPGVSLLWVRLQLGLVADIPDVENSDFDIGLRPMVSITPPLLPIYGRLVLAVNNLLDEDLRTVAYGGALGLSISLAGIGVFAEAGFLPRSLNDEMLWVVEGRAGVSLGF